MLTKLFLSNQLSQSYIAFHGITDAIKVYEYPRKLPHLILSYTIPHVSMTVCPVHISYILFGAISAYHFRHHLRSTSCSCLFVSIVSILRLINIIELFLIYHSTLHYIEYRDELMRNKFIVIVMSVLTYILINALPIKNILGIASGHVLFNEYR